MSLRPYQQRAVEQVRAAYRAGARRPLLVLPTGGGKTICGVAVVSAALEKGRRVLWLAHRRELIGQASASLDRAGASHHGVVLAGHPRCAPSLPIQVASVQTLTARGQAPEADIIVVDEAHHAVATTWRAIVEAYPRLEALIGLTATPERGDRTALGDVFDHLVVGSTIGELQQLGHLVPCDVEAPGHYQDELAEEPIAALEKLRGRHVVAFCAGVREAQQLAAEATRRGMRAACVEGGTSIEDRERSLRAFEAGGIDVITNVFCLTEGWDAPIADACLLARGCASAATYLQMVGRVLRPYPGKGRAIVRDLRGVVYLHGLPSDERTLLLTGRPMALSPDAPALASCRACGAVYRWRPSCARCGAEAPPRPAQRVRASAVERVVRVASVGEQREAFDSLVGQARARSYKPAWVGVQFKARFGFWPKWPLPRIAAQGAA